MYLINITCLTKSVVGKGWGVGDAGGGGGVHNVKLYYMGYWLFKFQSDTTGFWTVSNAVASFPDITRLTTFYC